MYKLSIDHAKISYDFFASTVNFWQNLTEFSAKPTGIGCRIFEKFTR
jgi:hypothetical protein